MFAGGQPRRPARPVKCGYRGNHRAPGIHGPVSPGRSGRKKPRERKKSRRRPIFPKGCPLSIFGAGELDFRVRDGNGYGLSASVTRILLLDCDRLRPCARTVRARAPRSQRSSISLCCLGSDIPISLQPPDPGSEAEVVKPSTISTAQLHPSPDFHMPPIKQVVYLRSYPVNPVGNLISRRASHLDAISAYPCRT
ncbi:MAG: hypothetical protein QOD83_5080 [Solirubrobacteraceae bacterium]|nr:hypothetical protein [Solirubrobacteraceae bacterium]